MKPEELNQLMAECELTKTDVASIIGIGAQGVHNWTHRRVPPVHARVLGRYRHAWRLLAPMVAQKAQRLYLKNALLAFARTPSKENGDDVITIVTASMVRASITSGSAHCAECYKLVTLLTLELLSQLAGARRRR